MTKIQRKKTVKITTQVTAPDSRRGNIKYACNCWSFLPRLEAGLLEEHDVGWHLHSRQLQVNHFLALGLHQTTGKGDVLRLYRLSSREALIPWNPVLVCFLEALTVTVHSSSDAHEELPISTAWYLHRHASLLIPWAKKMPF